MYNADSGLSPHLTPGCKKCFHHLIQIPAWPGVVWASTLFLQKVILDGQKVEGKIIIGKEVFKSSLPLSCNKITEIKAIKDINHIPAHPTNTPSNHN
jgi:hypothetical protein